jgi:serine/threonine protein kinase/formylglycine-generating enzyme required for sulfatase activity
MSFAPPEELEEYRLVRPLGHGAMGQVYVAHDTLLDRPVAIKFVAGVELAPHLRERFFVEARALARLSHPNVVAVHRIGEVRGRPYLVYELVRGTPLSGLPRPVPSRQALEIAIGLARGLAAAHRAGVLHRDIKPANAILADDGQVKLLDFGLAKLLDAEHPYPLPHPAPPPPGAETGGGADSVSPAAATLSVPGRPDIALAATAPGTPAAASPELTAAGDLLGSPLYMAPELWRGAPASRQADVYSLGVLLYELCAGHAPHHGVPLRDLPQVVQTTRAPPLHAAAPGTAPPFAAIVDRCLVLDPAERFPSGDALREALEQLALQGGRGPLALPAGNPYRGLLAFEAEQRPLFFGRGAEARAALDRLRAEPFVLVAGDSGVGKSSLCRAGVVPLWCEEGGQAVALVPGRQPLFALAAALARFADRDPGALAAALAEEPGEVVRRLAGRRLLLFVDQMEELLTLAPEDEAARFGQALAALTRAVRLLGAVRSDFLGRLAGLPGIGEQVPAALFLLRPLSRAGLHEAIVAPAQVMGYRFAAPEMVEALIQSVGRAPGGLPLLQFALAELWEARDPQRQVIPAAALAELGGVEGALARHADGVLLRLSPAQHALARRLLLRLVTPDGTRLRRTRSELLAALGPGVDEVLEALVRGRLLLARQDAEAGTYEIAHEALLLGWDTLRSWLSQDAEARAARQRVERAAAEWERLGRAPEALWSARQLAEAAALAGDLAPAEAAFLDASRRAARRRRLWRAALVLFLPLSLLAVVSGSRLHERRLRDRRVAAHLQEADRALGAAAEQEGRLRALRAAALSALAAPDPRRHDAAEASLADVRDLAERALLRHAEAGRAIEAALLLDPSRLWVRKRYAEVLYRQVQLLQLLRRRPQAEELRRRMAMYDTDGALVRRLSANAHLTLRTTPAGAEVLLRRVVPEGGHRRLAAPQPAGRTPLVRYALSPGAYVVLLRAPDRPEVRYPILLSPEEAHEASLPLPARVPAGMVYVPPGRFLYGSGEEETLRRDILMARPLHEVWTGAYLIGRTEVTYADWIAFLRDLPPPERARRRPHAGDPHGAKDLRGFLDLHELPNGGFALRFQPTQRMYTVRTGERLRYPGRRERAEQDLLRLPVTGISVDDAEAYAAWLDRTGRLPGARLCDEHEWERAARGADDRPYPHGDRLFPDDANHDATYGRDPLSFGPDEAGVHPLSDSPFGVADLAGSVWEWVRSVSGREQVVMRGGSFYQDQISARSDNRQPGEPTLRSARIGLRLCARP